MTKEQRSKLVKAWAKMNILCGVLDPTCPESDFPKGRLPFAHNKAVEAWALLDELIAETPSND